MKVRLASRGDLLKIWKEDFLGNRGFFLPGEEKFALGEEMDLVLEVDNVEIGKAKVCVAWQNLYGKVSEFTPRGSFLKIINMDSDLEKTLGI